MDKVASRATLATTCLLSLFLKPCHERGEELFPLLRRSVRLGWL